MHTRADWSSEAGTNNTPDLARAWLAGALGTTQDRQTDHIRLST